MPNRGIAATYTISEYPQENCDFFGYNPNQTDRAESLASGSMIYDVLNDYIIDAKINKYNYSERKSAMEHLDRIKNYRFFQRLY